MVISNGLTFLAQGQSFHESNRAVEAAIEINNKHIFLLVPINKDPLKMALQKHYSSDKVLIQTCVLS